MFVTFQICCTVFNIYITKQECNKCVQSMFSEHDHQTDRPSSKKKMPGRLKKNICEIQLLTVSFRSDIQKKDHIFIFCSYHQHISPQNFWLVKPLFSMAFEQFVLATKNVENFEILLWSRSLTPKRCKKKSLND